MTEQEKELQLSNKYNTAQVKRLGNLSDKLIEEIKDKEITINYLRNTLAKVYSDLDYIDRNISLLNLIKVIDKINDVKSNISCYEKNS